MSETFNKFQLCTSNLKVPTHESNYVYRYVVYANSFKDKAILTLENQDFELGCIIQYRWKFCPVTHWNFSDRVNKFQLCTSYLTFTIYESNYIYCYVRFANGFSYKAIFTLDNRHFEQWCIIQYWWKCYPSHIEMCLTRLNKFQLCTSNLTIPNHESNYVYRYVRFAKSSNYKVIFILDNRAFEQRCIIQYRWKFCPSHIEMCLTRSVNFSCVHVI